MSTPDDNKKVQPDAVKKKSDSKTKEEHTKDDKKEKDKDKDGGDKKARPKTLKIGFLFVEQKGRMKKTFKSRFCILTNACEIEWYKKQEDQVDHKPAGAFKNLHLSEIAEVEEQNNIYLQYNQNVFSTKYHNKTYYFGAVDHQDRMNWMVEILKLRPIPDVINLLDSPTISRHAAFALANLAGSKAEGVQTGIVTNGGVEALVKYLFKANASDSKLMDSIYYSFPKLCEAKDENKAEIGKDFGLLYSVFAKGEQERWKGFIAQAILHCAKLDENKIRLGQPANLKWLFDNMLLKDLTDQSSKTLAEVVYQCSFNDDNKTLIVKELLQPIINSFSSAKTPVQAILLRTISNIAHNEARLEEIKNFVILPTLIPFLVVPKASPQATELQEEVANLILLLTANDNEENKNQRELRDNSGLQHLVSSLNSESLNIKEANLATLLTYVGTRDDNALDLAILEEELIQMIDLLSSKIKSLQEKTLKILLYLSTFEPSRTRLTQSDRTIISLLDNLAISTEDFPNESLQLVSNYSDEDRVKLQISKHSINQLIFSRLLEDKEPLIHTLAVLRNCSTQAYPKIIFSGQTDLLKKLVSILSPDYEAGAQVLSALIIANCVADSSIAFTIKNLGGVSALIHSLSSTDEDLLQNAARALATLALNEETENLIGEQNGLKPLVSLLVSPNHKVRELAARALRNCSVFEKNKSELIKIGGLKALVDTLEVPNSRLQEHSALALRNCLSKDEGSENAKLSLGGYKSLLTLLSSPEIKVLEASLWALTCCISNVQDRITLTKLGGVKTFLDLIDTRIERCREYLSQLVAECLKRDQNQTEVDPKTLDKVFSLLSSSNIKVVEPMLSIIFFASKNVSMRPLIAQGVKAVIPFLVSPHHELRYLSSEALLNSLTNDDNEIEIKSPSGLPILLNASDIHFDACSWKLRLPSTESPSQHSSTQSLSLPESSVADSRVTVNCTKRPILSLSYNNQSQLRIRLARAIAYSQYNSELSIEYLLKCDDNLDAIPDEIIESRGVEKVAGPIPKKSSVSTSTPSLNRTEVTKPVPIVAAASASCSSVLQPSEETFTSSFNFTTPALSPPSSASTLAGSAGSTGSTGSAGSVSGVSSSLSPPVSSPLLTSLGLGLSSPTKTVSNVQLPSSQSLGLQSATLGQGSSTPPPYKPPAVPKRGNLTHRPILTSIPESSTSSAHGQAHSLFPLPSPLPTSTPHQTLVNSAPLTPTSLSSRESTAPERSGSSEPKPERPEPPVRPRPSPAASGPTSPRAAGPRQPPAVVPLAVPSPKNKVSAAQILSLAHYRRLVNPSIDLHFDSVLSSLREVYLKDVDETQELYWAQNLNQLNEECGRTIHVEDKYIVRYTGGDMSVIGTVQTKLSLADDIPWPYFEILILSAGSRGTIGIGLALENYLLNQQPGWLPGSFAYHGDDGNKYTDGLNEIYGPRFTTGDVIGCGYNNINNQIFFTKNGQIIGSAFEKAPARLYPTVGLASPGEAVHFNFGQTPFLFDFDFDCPLVFTKGPLAKIGNEAPSVEVSTTGEAGAIFDSLCADMSFLPQSVRNVKGPLEKSQPRSGLNLRL